METSFHTTSLLSNDILPSNQSSLNIEKPKIPCPYCGKLYLQINIHISRAHREQRRQIIVNRHKTGVQQVSQDEILHTATNTTTITTSQSSVSSTVLTEYNKKIDEWKIKFSEDLLEDSFHKLVEDFLSFLSSAIHMLPGPKHRASKYYELRKKKSFINTQRSYQNSTNPERSTKRDRLKRQSKYNYETTQFYFYNQRRKAIRNVFNDNDNFCKIDNTILYDYFFNILSVPNDNIRIEYPKKVNEADQVQLNDLFNTTISKQEISMAMNKISIDIASGPDHVLMRTVKNGTALEIIALIATRMLKSGIVPPVLQQARSVLISKGGDTSSPSNWRPITITSVVRRVIERTLDSRLCQYISFNQNQCGFTNSPGTHINTTILNAALKSAKENANNITVVFLDIRKAFDNIGHLHLSKTLNSIGIPNKLSTLIMNLQRNNTTIFETKMGKLPPLSLKRGVLQGSPISPTLYNLATDFILEELCEQSLSEEFGYPLHNQNLTAMSFADDTVIIAKNLDSATELTNIALQCFQEIGLSINASKSICLSLTNGKFSPTNLLLSDNNVIPHINPGEKIRYLGINIQDEIIFDSVQTLQNLQDKADTLANSPLLQADQKFIILNSSISPTLIYPFQIVPFEKIPTNFLIDADKLLKNTLKDILQLPTDVPDHMLYSERKYKGLGLFKATWEMRLQHINICSVLKRANDPLVNQLRDFESECLTCLRDLNIPLNINNTDPLSLLPHTRKIRKELREREFHLWCDLPHKGRGVKLFSEYTPANQWIRDHRGLSCSEWRDAIKLTAAVSAVRTLPGRSQNNNLCRRCGREPETLAHVLGACPYGELLRNCRHHTIRSMLATALKETGYQVYEEVHGLSSEGSSRRIDIIAFRPSIGKGIILDPTVRFESHSGQPEEVDKEKRSIYEPTVDYYKHKYNLSEISVIGLMIGARGTIPKFLHNFCITQGLHTNLLSTIAISALRGSISILRHHLFNITQ